MAYEIKYKCEFADIAGEDWVVDILEDDFAGDIINMTPTGDPLVIEWPSTSDNVFDQNIRGSQATIGVYAESSFQYAELFTSDNLEFKVNIYKNTSELYWTGWITANTWSEPYAGLPYPVSISVVDGLGLLKDFDFSTLSLTNRQTASKIIYDILGTIGFTAFTEFVNVYDILMMDSVDDSPLDQSHIETDLFEDSDLYEALSEILRTFNAAITQRAGVIIIYRYKELEDTTMRGRIFTSATARTSTTRTPAQNISRTTTPSDFLEIGGTLMITPQLGTLTANQNYGSRDSWIKNFNFDADTHTIATGVFTDWTKTIAVLPVGAYVEGETSGVITAGTAGTPGVMISQIFGSAAMESTTDVIGFEFEWGLFNPAAPSIDTITVKMVIKIGSTYYLDEDDDIYLQWDASSQSIEMSSGVIGQGWSGWTTFKRRIPGLPADGPLTIEIYETHTSGSAVFGAIKNIKFFSTSDEITVLTGKIGGSVLFNKWFNNKRLKDYINIEETVNRTYIKDNSVNGQDVDLLYLLGDATGAGMENILPQFMGAIGTRSLASVAASFVTVHASDYVAGGVVVTSSGEDIIFTAAVAGVNFTGATTITNTAGTLDGSVTATQANVVPVAQEDRIEVTGSSGSARINTGDTSADMTWATDAQTTIDNFVSTNAVSFLTFDIVLSRFGSGASSRVAMLSNIAGQPFTTSVDPLTGDLDGSITNTTLNTVGVKRIDTITLEGTSGTADILCDGVTEEVAWVDTLTPTTIWDTRGGSEADPIIELICGEIGSQFARPKHLLDISVYERNNAFLDLVGNLQDDMNQYSGSDRVFIMNSATYEARMRRWDLSLNELL